MGLSQVQGCCHFCKHHPEVETQHLFYNCKIIIPVIQYIQTLFFEVDDVTFDHKGTENGVTFKAEMKENLILRQKYYNNTSPNIVKEINYTILKLN